MKYYYNKLVQGKERCTILLYGEIGDEYGKNDDIVAEIMEAQSKYNSIEVRINSRGGDVFAGIAIFNALRECKADVRIYIDGLAASMASVIAFCGHHVEMSKYARLMLHCVSGSCFGNISDLQKCIAEIEEIENSLCEIYAQKLHIVPEEVKRRYFDGKDHWITAEEALGMGLIDGIFDIDAEPPGDSPDDIYSAFIARLENQPYKFGRVNGGYYGFKRQIAQLLGISPDNPDKTLYTALKRLKNDTEAVSNNALIEKAIKMGWIETEQKAMFAALAKYNQKAFRNYIEEKRKSEPLLIDELINQAESRGKILPIERDTYKAIGNVMGATVLGRLFSIKPGKRLVMRDLGLDKEDRSKWSFDDWRTYAPDELRNNPKLYNDLKNREDENGLIRDLEWYRKNNPDYLKRNPEIYRQLTENMYNTNN